MTRPEPYELVRKDGVVVATAETLGDALYARVCLTAECPAWYPLEVREPAGEAS